MRVPTRFVETAETDVGTPYAPPLLDGNAERVLATESGDVLIFGWIGDEGCSHPTLRLHGAGSPLTCASQTILRHRRRDVEAARGASGHDFGYLLYLKLSSKGFVGEPLMLGVSVSGRQNEYELRPQRVSDQGLLEELLSFLGFFDSHRGRETSLQRFLLEGGRAAVADIYFQIQQRAAQVQCVERFGSARPGPSFQTVLFGDMEAALFQPILFAKAGIEFGEWVYACNSPDQADDLMRIVRTVSNLYDLPICAVVLSGNAGFGGANNEVIQYAAGRQIVLINPDVQPIPMWTNLFNLAIRPDRFVNSLRGALLFYDDELLMHGGMYLEEDVHVSRSPWASEGDSTCRLLRVEHYDKGVPFIADEWRRKRQVAAVTGALMAFDRGRFEAIGGFSHDFIYGHYEDADLCLRWAERFGSVEVDPDIRLVHLEGQGSKTRLPHFHGAAIVNRHIFNARTRHHIDAERASSIATLR